MKISRDKNGRRIYKFRSMICQGGFLYSHKTKEGELIKNKEGLKNLLNAIAKKFELIDVTIKVYDNIFFLFYMAKPSINSQQIIDSIQQNIPPLGIWTEEYIITGADDLEEKYIKKEIEKWGYDYDKR